MAQTLTRILRQAARRTSLNVLLEQCALVLTLGAATAGAALVIERALSLHFLSGWPAAAFAAAMVLSVGVLVFVNRPRPLATALLVDDRLRLRERFSTALAMAGASDPFARAARAEAHQAAAGVDLAGQFPVRPSRRWLRAGAGWLVVLAIALWLPEMDLFGAARTRRQEQERLQQRQLAHVEIQDQTQKVLAAVKRVDPNLEKDLQALAKATEGMEPAEMRRQTIRKLTEMKDKVKNAQTVGDAAAVEALKQKLRQTRPGKLDPALAKVARAMGKGDFAGAAKALQNMRQELAEGKITPERRQELAQQMANLAEQLAAVAKDQQALKDALQKQGIKQDLADALSRMDPNALREALARQGLSPDQIDMLARQAHAMALAACQAQGLSEQMSKLACKSADGQLSAEDLAELCGQLSELEIQALRSAEGLAAMDQLNRAIAAMGRPSQCQGPGLCSGCGMCMGMGQGEGGIPGMGMGRGIGQGWRPTATGPTKLGDPTAVENPDDRRHPPIATWMFRGAQVRGEARKQLQEVLTAQQEGFAEAVQDKQIPRRHQKLVKDYYDRLEQSGE